MKIETKYDLGQQVIARRHPGRNFFVDATVDQIDIVVLNRTTGPTLTLTYTLSYVDGYGNPAMTFEAYEMDMFPPVQEVAA